MTVLMETRSRRHRLEQALYKFSKKQLVENVTKLPIFRSRASVRKYDDDDYTKKESDDKEESQESDEAINMQKSKAVIVEELLTRLKNKPEDGLVSQLSLLNACLYQTRHTWTMYRLVHPRGDFDLDALDLERSLKKRLDSSYSSDVAVQMNGDAYWIRIVLHPRNRRTARAEASKNASVVYAVYWAEVVSSYVGISRFIKKHGLVLLRALAKSLGYKEALASALVDRSLDGLFQLAKDKNNPDFQPKDTDDDDDDDDESDERPLRVPERMLDPRIRDLEASRFEKRSKYKWRHFGTGEQPKLQRLTYALRTPFGGTKLVPDMQRRLDRDGDGLFGCRVVFEGKSVVDGICQLVNVGVARMPLPRHLADVRTLGRNNFQVNYKKPRLQQDDDDEEDDATS